MSLIFKLMLPMLVGPLTGFISTYVMDLVDDVLKITANWPNPAKQALVIALTALLPAIAQVTGLTLPADPSNLATQPVVQSIVGAAVAFFVKHMNDKKATTPVIATPVVAAATPSAS